MSKRMFTPKHSGGFQTLVNPFFFSRNLRILVSDVAHEEMLKRKNKVKKTRKDHTLLTDEQVIEIRIKYQHESWNYKMIFEHYGAKWNLSEQYVYSLCNYLTRSKVVVL